MSGRRIAISPAPSALVSAAVLAHLPYPLPTESHTYALTLDIGE